MIFRQYSIINVYLFLFCFASYQAHAYNILVTVMALAGSQNLVMYRLAELLGQRGHHVTVLNAQFFPETEKIKLKYAEEMSYRVVEDDDEMESLRNAKQEQAWNATHGLRFGAMTKVFSALSKGCKRLIEKDGQKDSLIAKLRAKKFDVVVVHLTDFCTFGIANRLNIKSTIWMSTAFSLDFMTWYAGAPTPVSYVPSSILPMQDLGFLSRLSNAVVFVAFNALFQFGVVRTYTNIFRERYGDQFPSYNELLHSVQLHFINSDPLFEYPRPILHKMIYVGGLTMRDTAPLDNKWQKIVDDASNGFVVFSLGTVANTTFMSNDIKRAFTEAFSRLKQTVIWRLEGDKSIVSKASNIIAVDWLPQKDLIAHPKVKALMTHGGYNSLTEATYAGVPLIVLPLFGDQRSNSEKVERLQIGVTLDKNNLSADGIYNTLQLVINNATIQENARRLGNMIRKRPFPAKEAAVQWVEYLAEFQNLDQLTPAGQKLSLVEYFMVDVFATVILLTALLFSLWILFTVWIFNLIRRCVFGSQLKTKIQ